MKQLIACLMMVCLPVISVAQSGIGQENQESIANLDSLLNAAMALYDEGAYEDALELAKANTIQAEKQVGKAHEYYAHSLVILGVIYQELGKYEEAEPLFQEALAVIEQVLGKGHIFYSVTLGDLASLYHDLSRFEEAEKLFEEAKANIERLGQTISEDYATNVNNYGIMLQELGQYERAEKEFEIVRGIYEQLYGRKSQQYGTWLNNMGLMLTDLGQFEKAEAYLKEAIEINNVVLKDHPDRAYSLNNLARVYFYQNRHEEALPLFSEARDIRKAHYGESHPRYASSLEYLATVHHSLGNYREAESLMLESKQIKANLLGEDHPSYATTLSNLAIFYQEIGDYEKAEQYLLEVMEIRKAKIGTDHPNYAFALNNMAALYQETGRFEEAAGYLSEAIPVWKNVYGKEHPFYARGVQNLGKLHASLEKYEKAEPYFLEALSIWEKNFGKSHAEYIACLADLASLHQETGQFGKASAEFSEAESLMFGLFGAEHPDYEGLLNRKGQFEYLAGKPAQALASLQKASSIRKKLLARAAQHLSEQELIGYVRKFKDASDMLFSFTADAGADYPQAVASSFDGLLFYKGFLLEGARSLPKAVYTSGDEALAKTYEQWKALQRQLGKLYSLPEGERSGLSAVAGEAEELEKALASRVAGFRESQRQVGWRDVQSQLRPGEAAIEFAQFRYFNKSDWADSTLYCAYILRPGYDAPRLAYLFEERELEKLFESIPERKRESLDNLYALRGLTPEDSRASSGEDLLRMIWLPFDSLLRGVKRVYLSPSGLLNRVNFAALPFSEKEMLGSRYEIHLLGSTRQLVFRKEASAPPVKSALLLGGIRYDRDTASALVGNEKLVEEEEAIFVPEGPAFVSRSEGSGFGYLPGTLEEARDIGKTLANEGFKVKLLEGYQGTEDAFKQTGRAAPSPRVLHIATHGYFFPDLAAPPAPPKGGEKAANPGPSGRGGGAAFKVSDHPMIRSGLLLAGANPAWKGETTPPGREDGILTAYEISQMDLSGTELVVLSACETGLGDIEGNEGVYGLQRAFKIAGAKYLIMSLWSVADEETAEFMATFYREWLGGKGIHAAFRDTQQAMRAWYPEEPYLWAGFVLVE